MHESVVTLQELIDDDRSTCRAMNKQLEQATAQGVTLLNTAYLEEQVRMRAKRSDQLDGLIEDYVEADRLGDSAASACKLVMIQLAAARIIETRNAHAGNGLE
ncbi:hypothetical protein ACQP2T_61370 [Nonomuraea sp. CA-143628]|uniref:hypothetical protein n=1 Tax=Nonomuraea sp. CA-143628 TaxID=3239997 RepID=UPI003D8F055C